jgi:hypothetical protein
MVALSTTTMNSREIGTFTLHFSIFTASYILALNTPPPPSPPSINVYEQIPHHGGK